MCASRVATAPKPGSKRAVPKLARGRHPLTQQAVADSQRTRMLDAVARVVAHKGYSDTTVADVIALAGVSRRTFYEMFPGIEDCYLAAYEHGMGQVLGAIREAVSRLPKADWRSRTRAAIEAYLGALAALPDAAWAYTIEVQGAGRRALQGRAWVIDQWLAQWRTLQTRRMAAEPGTQALEDTQLLALVGGIEELVRDCLQRKGAQHLPELLEPACRFAMTVLEAAGSPQRPAAASKRKPGPRGRPLL
jgi:AcrR family transcriptional regulator